MCGGKLAGILHVAPEVPELLQSDLGDVNNVIRLIDRGFWVRSPWSGSTEWHNEAGEILVEGEESEHSGWRRSFGF